MDLLILFVQILWTGCFSCGWIELNIEHHLATFICFVTLGGKPPAFDGKIHKRKKKEIFAVAIKLIVSPGKGNKNK